jgi:dTDP-glucose pyrophosphorylase
MKTAINYELKKYLISKDATIIDALIQIEKLSEEGVLTLFVINNQNQIIGTVTQGDIRRFLITNSILKISIEYVMNKEFCYIQSEDIDIELIKKYRNKKIQLIPIISRNGNLNDIINFNNYYTVLPVDAVLMAGGKGERLRPLTQDTPKPLLEIGNKCIIDYNVDNLVSVGIKNIHITVNYLAEQIIKHFSNSLKYKFINCIKEKDFFGTIGSLRSIKNLNHDSIIIMNSDLFTNIDFEELYINFINSKSDLMVATIPYSYSVPYGIFELDGLLIKGIKEKPKYNYFANAGIYILKKEIIKLIPEDAFFDATDMIELLISLRKPVSYFPIVGYWIDIGRHEDYSKAQNLVKYIEKL